MFGLLNEPEHQDSLDPKHYETRRGRFFLIWNASKTSGRPMLIALMAGHAAYEAEYTSTDQLMSEATDRLRGVFGAHVPDPLEVIVTRWRRDRFTRGTYSFVAPETQPGDYDLMAKPVGNLHFAGEATCGTHPATVHGALLSGLRVAADVVEAMVGPIDTSTSLASGATFRKDWPIITVAPTAVQRENAINGVFKARNTEDVSSHGSITPTTLRHSPSDAASAIKNEESIPVAIDRIPSVKPARPHFVMQPAAPPAQSVCASDPSFWASVSTSADKKESINESMIIAFIYEKIGERPAKPSRPGVNPFLLYTKDKWDECKAFCSNATTPLAGAGRDVIRQTLGKWWKAADSTTKQPYVAQSQAAQEQADIIRRAWEATVARWDADAMRIRREYLQSHTRGQEVISGDIGHQ